MDREKSLSNSSYLLVFVVPVYMHILLIYFRRLNIMRKTDYISIAALMLIPFLIFYPLFYSSYLYTDEAVQLWHYVQDPNFHMFTSQGRYITEKIFRSLFSLIDTIERVKYLRLFSFFGWLISIPIWYTLVKRVIVREGLPDLLAFFSVVYLITMPPFSVYVSWASCMELFVANTSALLSGYILYHHFRKENNGKRIAIGVVFSLVFGIVSLFTYQTGFGCFLLPFLLHLIAQKKITRVFWAGVLGCFAIYLVYFLLFKFGMAFSGDVPSDRATVYFNPIRKVFFMLTRPLAGSFHFTYLFNERSMIGVFVYVLLAGGWLILSFQSIKARSIKERGSYFLALLFLLFCIYIPGLIVKENYASNRTLFALNLAVFFMVFETVFSYVHKLKIRNITVTVLTFLFLVNAWYNFHVLFLSPIKKEYEQLSAYLETNLEPNTHTVHFIRPQEDFFVQRYGVTRSWDEFGVPSTFFDWVPEPLVKQIVLEKTGDRTLVNNLVVKHWLGKEAYQQSGERLMDGILLIDAEEIISK